MFRAPLWARWSACFFFSSRRRHTRLQGDWSSDVCSSDLVDVIVEECDAACEIHDAVVVRPRLQLAAVPGGAPGDQDALAGPHHRIAAASILDRKSAREGKRGDLGGRRIIKKKK